MASTTFQLNNGISMPPIGFGTYLIEPGAATSDAVSTALANGYRHIDTAAAYKNEQSVGEAIHNSGMAREDLFITTKLWNADIRKGKTEKAFEKSLQLLGLDYVDLYLIHWPAEGFVEAWLTMEALYKTGRIKAIGISNFQQHHIETLIEKASVTPAVNQVECHPYLSQVPLREYCAKQSILVQAWSPLGGKGGRLLKDKTILQIAEKHGKQPAQVILRWLLQSGIAANVKSTHEERIRDNIQVFNFELDDTDMSAVNGLNKDKRFGPDPDHFKF